MEINNSTDLSRDIFQIMRYFARLKVRHSEELTRSGQVLLVMLTLNQNETKSPLTVTEISNLLMITPAGVTHLVNPLEEAGFIERLQDPKDRRIVRIGLTEKGDREAAASISEINNYLVEVVNLLGEEDSKTFIRLVSRVVAHFSS